MYMSFAHELVKFLRQARVEALHIELRSYGESTDIPRSFVTTAVFFIVT